MLCEHGEHSIIKYRSKVLSGHLFCGKALQIFESGGGVRGGKVRACVSVRYEGAKPQIKRKRESGNGRGGKCYVTCKPLSKPFSQSIL